MKRVIIDHSKLTNEILSLLVEKFPDGYGYRDIVSFKTIKGETINAVEVNSDDTVYLVKVSAKLDETMEDFEPNDNIEFDTEQLEEDFDAI